KITNFQNHQGYVALISNFEYFDINYLYKKIEQNQVSKILILDHIQDPQNLGSILRTANAFSWEHIIIPNKRAATINSTVLKVASGGENNLKIYKVNSLFSVCQNLKKLNFWIYSSSLNKTKTIPLYKVDKLSKKAIILGNEGKGVSNTLLNISDQEFYIPMSGSVESLNVSIATGIILYMLK
ncbi:MAG: 23S rRNA (guanosine(2251)-2'-O)-methyltransferase RlmB, partial [Mycoplasma sp.]|nr:23S rRNA (guanosine(2251)-2'-O)-methyltransferase RlmB [Mycoplasma sp.]